MMKSVFGLKNLRNCQVSFNWCTLTPAQDLKGLVKVDHTNHKEITFKAYNTVISPEALSSTLNKLALKKCLTHFTIIILNCHGFGKEQFGLLAKTLQTFKSLEHLTLKVSPNYDVSEAERQEFYSVFSSFRALTSFTLELKPRLGNMTDFDLVILGSKLQDLVQLHSLGLSFDMNHDISDKGCQALLKGISNLRDLQEFVLFIEKKSQVTDETFKSLRDCLANLVLLKTLSIRVFKCRLSGECIKELWQGMKALTSLESLTLKLTNTNNKFGGINYLRNLLSEQKQLIHVSLGIPISNRNTEIQALVEGISFLKSVRVLKLKIEGIPLTGSNQVDAYKIKEAIKKLPRLKKLYWEISSSLGMSYEAELYETVKSLEFVSWDDPFVPS